MKPMWKYLPMVVAVVVLCVAITVAITAVIESWLDDYVQLQESSAPTDAAAATGTDDHADNRVDATELTTSAEGRIDSEGDVDYFRIDIPKRLAVTVHTISDLDTVGQLEDDSGAELDSDDDGAEGFMGNRAFYRRISGDFRLSAELDPGTYYVRIKGTTGFTGNVSYTVHLTTTEIAPSLSLSLGEDHRFISSGDDHTCGLRADGTAVCWGDSRFSLTSPPAGERFASISSGEYYTCGLRADGTAVCWGRDNFGQTSPPAR